MQFAQMTTIYQTLSKAIQRIGGNRSTRNLVGLTTVDIPLRPSPSSDWDMQFEKLLESEFLRCKYNRKRRLADKWAYIDRYVPELLESSMLGANVIDIGPGPGEFLECCRTLGYQVLGVDAACGEGGMGDEYLQLSKLLTQRQDLRVEYCGLSNWMDHKLGDIPEGSVLLINSQGSIEQACSHLMTGVPHHEHHDCRRLEWQSGPELQAFFSHLMSVWQSWLSPGGIVLIAANGAANTDAYATAIERAAEDSGELDLVFRSQRIHKWKKRSQ